MIQMVHADGVSEKRLLDTLKARSGEIDRTVTASVT